MGALKYVEELQKKKQSDILRFLLRVRCWEVSSLFRSLELPPRATILAALWHLWCPAIHSLNTAESASI